jgi:hypothetical protein
VLERGDWEEDEEEGGLGGTVGSPSKTEDFMGW